MLIHNRTQRVNVYDNESCGQENVGTNVLRKNIKEISTQK